MGKDLARARPGEVTYEHEILFLPSKRSLGNSRQQLEYIIKSNVRDENCDDSANKGWSQIEFL
jgi:hypothetical protein